LSGANNSLSSVQLQHQLLQQQMAVLKEDAMSSAAAAANAAATLSAYEMRIETMAKALEEQRSAHSMELHQTRDELYVIRLLV
jgi:sugar (pentulose or hexulose) kinase